MLPSFIDRAPFFQLLLEGRWTYYQEQLATQPGYSPGYSDQPGQAKQPGYTDQRGYTADSATITEQPHNCSSKHLSIDSGNSSSTCHTAGTRQLAAKAIFDELLVQQFPEVFATGSSCMQVRTQSTTESTNNTQQYSKLLQAFKDAVLSLFRIVQSTHRMSFMYCEILSNIHMAQAFLWLQVPYCVLYCMLYKFCCIVV